MLRDDYLVWLGLELGADPPDANYKTLTVPATARADGSGARSSLRDAERSLLPPRSYGTRARNRRRSHWA